MFSRLSNLVRGIFGQWMVRREHKNPAAVYESAISSRLQQYGTLRDAAAGVLYMKGKLSKELKAKSGDLVDIEAELARAIDCNDDDIALALIRRREGLSADIARLNAEVQEVTQEADTAKRNLVAFQDEIVRLRDEKVRMLARWANAKARRRFQDAMQGLSLDADIRALDEVREHIQRAAAGAQLNADVGESSLDERLRRRRDAEALAGAREELDRLKHLRGQRLLPVVLAS